MLVSAVITFHCMINITQASSSSSSCGHPQDGENKNAYTFIMCQNHFTGKELIIFG